MNEYERIHCRSAHIAVKYRGHLMIWGGYKEVGNSLRNHRYHSPDEIFVYSPQEESWQRILTKGDMPPENSGTSAVILEDFLYVFGGFIRNGANSNHLYRLNLLTKEWERLYPKGVTPAECDKLVGWTYKGRLYFFGGFGPESEGHYPYEFVIDSSTLFVQQQVRGWNNQLLMYDPATNEWSWPRTRGLPPKPRAAHAGDITGDDVYIFGGRHQNTRLNDLHWLNMKTMTWHGLDNIIGIEGRSWHTFSFIDSTRAVIYGGLNTTNSILTNLSVFDTKTLTLLNSSETHPRLWHQAKYFDETKQLIVCGGYIDSIFENDCDQAEEILIIHFGPKSLLTLCIDTVLTCNRLKTKWSMLPVNLVKILENRSQLYCKTFAVNI